VLAERHGHADEDKVKTNPVVCREASHVELCGRAIRAAEVNGGKGGQKSTGDQSGASAAHYLRGARQWYPRRWRRRRART